MYMYINTQSTNLACGIRTCTCTCLQLMAYYKFFIDQYVFLIYPSNFYCFHISIHLQFVYSFPSRYIQGCIDGDIRLADGANSTEGRVEVCVGTAWTTICDEGWDHFAAKVICRELGFSHPGTSYTNLTSNPHNG